MTFNNDNLQMKEKSTNLVVDLERQRSIQRTYRKTNYLSFPGVDDRDLY